MSRYSILGEEDRVKDGDEFTNKLRGPKWFRIRGWDGTKVSNLLYTLGAGGKVRRPIKGKGKVKLKTCVKWV